MDPTNHAKKRMAQRGISRNMVEYVLTKGIPEGERVVMDRKEALRILEDLQDEQRLLKKILDKGGVVVIADGDTLITTYNYQRRDH